MSGEHSWIGMRLDHKITKGHGFFLLLFITLSYDSIFWGEERSTAAHSVSMPYQNSHARLVLKLICVKKRPCVYVLLVNDCK